MKITRMIVVLVLAAAFAGRADAVGSSIWSLKDSQAFSSGKMKNLSMSSRGQMRLNSEFKKMETDGADSMALWSSAIDSKGVAYFGTGTGAAIYRLGDDKLERIKLDDKYTTDLIVTCMAADSKDNIYAALLPSGRIIRITPGGVVSEYAILRELYIWDICIDPRGALYVATGPAGRLYRITENGKKIDRLYDSDEDHIFSVTLGEDGTLYFGTSQNAILFKLPPVELKKKKPRPTVIYDFPGTDIRAIYAQGDDIFLVVNNAQDAESYSYLNQIPGGTDEEDSMEYPTAGYARGTVYRMDKNGDLETVLTVEDLIANIRGEGGSIFIAAVGQNLIYKYDINKKEISFFQIDEPQALTFEIFRGHLAAIGTSGPGVVYKVSSKPSEEGMYTSRVFDAGNPCKWGTIQYRASGKLAVQTRTGSTETPDSTWSDWSEFSDNGTILIKSPEGRFIQFRVTWADKKAVLDEISLSYMVANLRPSIQSIMVGPAESNNHEYPSLDDLHTPRAGQMNGGGVLGGRNLQVTWEASDPNGDALEFRVYYKEEREKRWKLLTHDGPVQPMSWRILSGLFPSGRYRVKVVASDKPGNPDGNALKREMISEEFIIDNTPPRLSGLNAVTARNITKITGLAVEETTRVTGIEYAIDGAMWKSSMPEDKIFDSRREKLAIILEGLEPGEHTIVVRVSDETGNSGTAHLVFETPESRK